MKHLSILTLIIGICFVFSISMGLFLLEDFMVKNNRMEFRVDFDTKENFRLKAKSLGISLNELFELLCNKDIGIKEKDLYGIGLNSRKNLKINEKANNLCNHSSEKIFEG